MSTPTDNPTPATDVPADVPDSAIGTTPAYERAAFMDRAAKAVWAFITAFALAMANAIIPVLIDGRFPTSVEWITAFGIGLAGAYGVGHVTYAVTNKPEAYGSDA